MAYRKRDAYVTCKMLLNALQELPEEEFNPVFEIKRPGKTHKLRDACGSGKGSGFKRERLESVDSEDVLIFSVKSRSQKRLKLLGNSVNEQGEGSTCSGISSVLMAKVVNIQPEKETKSQTVVEMESKGDATEVAMQDTEKKPRLDSFSSCSDKQIARPEALNVSRIDLHSDAKKIKIGHSAQSQPSLEFDVSQYGLI